MRAAALVLCTLGCASAESWNRVDTPNFVLRADLDARSTVEAAKALEDARDALVSAAWPQLDFDALEPTEVYVVSSLTELQRTFGTGVAGLFSHWERLRIFLGGTPGHWETRADLHFPATSYLRHEMAHQLASVVYRRQPRWFAEGLAQFLETVAYSEDRSTVSLGAPNVEALHGYRAHRSVTVRQVLDWGRNGSGPTATESQGLYGTSWLLVHWLYNAHGAAFTRYQRELARGTDPWRAWDLAFPAFDVEAADRELYRYSQHGAYVERTFPARKHGRGFTARPLPAAEGHACRALVAFTAAVSNPARAEDLLAEGRTETLAARTLDPDDVDGLMLSFAGDPLDAATRARRALAAHPEDPRAHLLLSFAAGYAKDSPAAVAAARQAVELAPGNADALNNLAWLLIEAGRVPAALGYAMRAAKRAPWDANVLDTLARALFLSGACERALALQRQVTDAPANGAAADTDFRKRLAEYTAKCGNAGPPVD
jgi:Flp pilus assembly protein TadD